MSCIAQRPDGSFGDLCEVFFGEGFTTANHADCWVHSNNSDDFGQVADQGCGNGYAGCIDDGAQFLGDSEIGGPRWLHYDPSPSGTVDAWGRQEHLFSDPDLNLLPMHGGTFISGSWWQNDGTECFNVHACGSEDGSIQFPGDERSGYCVSVESGGQGAPDGAIIPGSFPTRIVAQGYGYNGTEVGPDGIRIANFGLFCKRFDANALDNQFHVYTDRYMSPDNLRFYQRSLVETRWAHESRNCTDNPLVKYAGRVVGSGNPIAWVNSILNDPPHEFYNFDNRVRSIFDHLELNQQTMFFKVPAERLVPDLDIEIEDGPGDDSVRLGTVASVENVLLKATETDVRTAKFKTRVMKAIRDWTGNPQGTEPWDVVLDRLDHEHLGASLNTKLGDYSRTFDATDHPDPFSAMIPVEANWAKIRGTNDQVGIGIFIRKVAITLSLRPSMRRKITGSGLDDFTKVVRTHVRLFYDIDIAVRVGVNDFGIVDDPTGLTLPEDQHERQLVYGDRVDGVIRPFRLHKKMRWMGYHGRAGDRFSDHEPTGGGLDGEAIARAMRVRVNGWPTSLEKDDGQRATTYGGGVSIAFRDVL